MRKKKLWFLLKRKTTRAHAPCEVEQNQEAADLLSCFRHEPQKCDRHEAPGFRTEVLSRRVEPTSKGLWLDVRVVRWFVPRDLLQGLLDKDTPFLVARAIRGAPGAAEELDMTDFFQVTKLCDPFY